MADNFTQIRTDLIRSAKLTPQERSILFVLISYANCEEIFIGQKRLSKESGMSRKLVMKAIDGLRKKKFITTGIKPDRSTLIYRLNARAVVTKKDNVVTKSDRGCYEKEHGVVTKSDTSNIKVSNIKLDKERIPYKEIIDFLNTTAGTNYRHTSGGTRKLIKARWNEGFRFDDFKKAITNHQQFKETKYYMNSQPSTIFNGKFENRIQEGYGNNVKQYSNEPPPARAPLKKFEERGR